MSLIHRFIHLDLQKVRWIFLMFFLLFFRVLISQVFGQEENQEQVKRLQRAIFIFNLSQQVEWSNLDELESFRIGVLGADRTFLDLQAMAGRRNIYGKPVEIADFRGVSEISNVQVLYVHNKYSFTIRSILNKISGKNILLITEDYEYNTSMINMVNVGSSFEYEINSSKIKAEGFVMRSSLKQHAISSSQRWKQLYKTTEKSLSKIQKKNQEQETIIKNKEDRIKSQSEKITVQEKEIVTKEEEINKRKRRIQYLYDESAITQKKYEEKVQIEKALEESIKQQIDFITHQEEKIKKANQEIIEQQNYLKEQNDDMKRQETILEKLKGDISSQRKINGLLIGLAVLFFIGGIFIYIGYLTKKKFNADLSLKNKAIHNQSIELEAKNKELEQFAYIASHDLQEPLNTISSFIGLIKEDYEEQFDEVGKESLVFIKEASERMRNLIDALLEYSRIGQAKKYVDVDCNALLIELEKDLKVAIEKSGAVINKTKLPVVKGVSVELRLLFQNLISNGMKFVRDSTPPKIDISYSRIDDVEEDNTSYWKFSIKDNGIGIPEDQQERVFAIFQRLHSRERFKGTGIGLAHCKKIVEAHGGKIWLTSKQGKGTTFFFTLPTIIR